MMSERGWGRLQLWIFMGLALCPPILSVRGAGQVEAVGLQGHSSVGPSRAGFGPEATGSSEVSTVEVGSQPYGLAFDGANIWSANLGDGTVSKVRVRDGALLGTYHTGTHPYGVTFDGANVWVSDISEKKVTKLRASDGARQGDFAVGGRPGWMSSDGENLWVPVAVGAGQGSLYKIRESDGKILGTFALGISPIASAFDGASTWVTGGNSILKVRSDGSVAGTFPAGGSPLGICVERDNVWVANRSGGTVSKMRRSDGLLLGTYRVGGLPYGVLFDGSEMWVTGDPETVVLRAGDGTRVMRPDLGLSATTGQVFDGVNIWAAALNRGALLKRER